MTRRRPAAPARPTRRTLLPLGLVAALAACGGRPEAGREAPFEGIELEVAAVVRAPERQGDSFATALTTAVLDDVLAVHFVGAGIGRQLVTFDPDRPLPTLELRPTEPLLRIVGTPPRLVGRGDRLLSLGGDLELLRFAEPEGLRSVRVTRLERSASAAVLGPDPRALVAHGSRGLALYALEARAGPGSAPALASWPVDLPGPALVAPLALEGDVAAAIVDRTLWRLDLTSGAVEQTLLEEHLADFEERGKRFITRRRLILEPRPRAGSTGEPHPVRAVLLDDLPGDGAFASCLVADPSTLRFEVLWSRRFDSLANSLMAAPSIAHGVYFHPTGAGRLQAYGLADGELRARLRLSHSERHRGGLELLGPLEVVDARRERLRLKVFDHGRSWTGSMGEDVLLECPLDLDQAERLFGPE